MDTERILTTTLNRAAEHAPAFDDTLLPAFGEQTPGRRPPRWGWLAAAASVLVAGVATWAITSGIPPRTATPAAPPTSTAGTTTPRIEPNTLSSDGLRPLVGTTWVAENVAGPVVGLPLAERPWVRFDADGTLHGHDGCNTLDGNYHVETDGLDVDRIVSTAASCIPWAGAGFTEALQGRSRFGLVPSGLLIDGGAGETLTLHALSPTEQAPPALPMLRFLNNTGQSITSVRITSPGPTVEQILLARGESTDYVEVPGDLYRYARVEVTFRDGGKPHLMPADYVGEVPLAPGWYTYVLSTSPLKGPDGGAESALVLGLEEAGRPAGQG